MPTVFLASITNVQNVPLHTASIPSHKLVDFALVFMQLVPLVRMISARHAKVGISQQPLEIPALHAHQSILIV